MHYIIHVNVMFSIRKNHLLTMSEMAKRNGILTLTYSPKDPSFFERIKGQGIDLGVMASFDSLLKEDFISIPEKGFINIHSSYLPQHRGSDPVFWALRNGDRYTGATIHFVSPRFDEGDIIVQEKLPIGPEDNYTSLLRKMIGLQTKQILKVLDDFSHDMLESSPQDDSAATNDPRPTESDRTISLDVTSGEILNIIRASENRGGGTVTIGPNRFKITKGYLSDEEGNGEPGTIVWIDESGFSIMCKDRPLYFKFKHISNPVLARRLLKGRTSLSIAE